MPDSILRVLPLSTGPPVAEGWVRALRRSNLRFKKALSDPGMGCGWVLWGADGRLRA